MTGPLLPPRNAGGIEPPDGPSDPPTLADIKNGLDYVQRVHESSTASLHRSYATKEDYANTVVYFHKICNQYNRAGDDKPVTIESIKEAIASSLREFSVDEKKARQREREEDLEKVQKMIKEALQPLEKKLDHASTLAIRTRNTTCGTDLTHEYEVVDFVRDDGTSYSPQSVGLPELLNGDIIDELSDVNLNKYLKHYDLSTYSLARDDAIRKLRVFLGVR